MKGKIKEMFSLYNIAIVACVIIIIVSLYIIFKPNKKEGKVTVDGVEVVQTNKKESEEISEKEARKIAVKQFKNLGENVKGESLELTMIQRKGEEYYYIVSKKNNIEVKIKGGKVTKINSSLVEETY